MDGPTEGRHQEVPKDILEEAERLAKKAMEGDDEEEATAPEGETMEE
jgi:20S proteasome subunit alpha 7